MRWALRFLAVFFVAWAAFMVSPFVALYDLARAAAARDWPRVEERVQIKALRIFLAKQIVAEYLRWHGRIQTPGSFGQNLAASAGASFVDPIIAHFVTPEAILDRRPGASSRSWCRSRQIGRERSNSGCNCISPARLGA